MGNICALTMDYIAGLHGWRGKLGCFVAGAFTVLGFAPFHCWPVIFVTLPFLFLMLHNARHWRSAAWYGLAFGYGYSMAGTYWIANALLVDPDQFAWLVPLSLLGLSLVFAVWFAPFGALVRATRTPSLGLNTMRFALLWAALEYARSYGMFGFPWNLLGTMALAHTPMIQLAAVGGTPLLSLGIVLLGLLPVWWLAIHPHRLRAAGITLAITALVYGYGLWRLPDTAPLSDNSVRIVQGNIAQAMKWSEAGRMQSASIYGALSRLVTANPIPPIILWPETALPFTLHESDRWTRQLASIVPPGGTIITGAVRSSGAAPDQQLFNSIISIDAQGNWQPSYDKHQLVPLGEFVPLRSILPIEKITPGGVDFSRGAGASTLTLAHVPAFSPIICYEVFFPWFSADRHHRPDWLFNATNDAWYGDSSGPYQSFDAARMRAVEQGLPLARAANTGISTLIDPYGRPLQTLPLGTRGVIDQALPKPLSPTPYARYGDRLALTILLLGWVATQWRVSRLKK